MDPFYIVSGLAALVLFVLIARNLNRLDRRERERISPPVEPPAPPASPPTSLPTQPQSSPAPPAAPVIDDQLEPPRSPAAPTPMGDAVLRPVTPLAPTPIPRDQPRWMDESETAKEIEPGSDQPPGMAAPVMPPVAAPVAPAESASPVEFSAYYPKEVVPAAWQPMVAYVFRSAAAGAVEGDAARQLGPRLDQSRVVGEPARVPLSDGAAITATPRIDGFQFNPPSITIGFYEDWHRFEFKVRADTAPLHQAVNGVLTFTVEGIIAADLPLSIFVGAEAASSPTTRPTTSVRARPYSAVFCSYSRRDLAVVERVERAYRALGMDYLRDLISLRSGEVWNPALSALIERADIFQLFWSDAAAASDHVRSEWQHALQLTDRGDGFIRPVYWTEPPPPVPTALSHLHFAYEPHLGQ